MEFKELLEPWSHYLLPDGRKMRCRHILMDIIQTGIDQDGNAQFHLNFGAMVHIEPTEEQTRKIIEESNRAQAVAESKGLAKSELQ